MIVLGIKGLVSDFEAIRERATSPEARRIFRIAAGKIRDAVRSNAPRRDGRLRRAIISFASRRRGRRADAAAYARVNVISGRITAPHGHLVAFGTKDRRPKRGKFLVFYAKRYGWVKKRMVRGMKPNPYFRRGVETAGPSALNQALADIAALIVK